LYQAGSATAGRTNLKIMDSVVVGQIFSVKAGLRLETAKTLYSRKTGKNLMLTKSNHFQKAGWTTKGFFGITRRNPVFIFRRHVENQD